MIAIVQSTALWVVGIVAFYPISYWLLRFVPAEAFGEIFSGVALFVGGLHLVFAASSRFWIDLAETELALREDSEQTLEKTVRRQVSASWARAAEAVVIAVVLKSAGVLLARGIITSSAEPFFVGFGLTALVLGVYLFAVTIFETQNSQRLRHDLFVRRRLERRREVNRRLLFPKDKSA